MGCDPACAPFRGARKGISIHAPRVGCDGIELVEMALPTDFNPRTPCGVRPGRTWSKSRLEEFQSTHPVWGATDHARHHRHRPGDFNPRTPCGVRPGASYFDFLTKRISIHAPRVGCDGTDIAVSYDLTISIHAPRVGCDSDYQCGLVS